MHTEWSSHIVCAYVLKCCVVVRGYGFYKSPFSLGLSIILEYTQYNDTVVLAHVRDSIVLCSISKQRRKFRTFLLFRANKYTHRHTNCVACRVWWVFWKNGEGTERWDIYSKRWSRFKKFRVEEIKTRRRTGKMSKRSEINIQREYFG